MSGVTVEPGRQYLIDRDTGTTWRPKPEHIGKPINTLRYPEDFDLVGPTDEAAAAPISQADRSGVKNA